MTSAERSLGLAALLSIFLHVTLLVLWPDAPASRVQAPRRGAQITPAPLIPLPPAQTPPRSFSVTLARRQPSRNPTGHKPRLAVRKDHGMIAPLVSTEVLGAQHGVGAHLQKNAGNGHDIGGDESRTTLDFNTNAPNEPAGYALYPGGAPMERDQKYGDGYISSLRARGDGSYDLDDSEFWGTIHADGSVSIKDKPTFRYRGFYGLIVGFNFDLTDAIMRARNDDPYTARKRKFLNATRTMREKMATDFRALNLGKQVAALPDRMEQLWRRPDLSPQRKRQLLFYLWDECDDSGAEPKIDAAARRARNHVNHFIRTTLPAGTVDAFTQKELRKFNEQRHSKEFFAPYTVRSAPKKK